MNERLAIYTLARVPKIGDVKSHARVTHIRGESHPILTLPAAETAKMNGVNPHAYLKATLEAIAGGHPASDIDQLLPWALTPISS